MSTIFNNWLVAKLKALSLSCVRYSIYKVDTAHSAHKRLIIFLFVQWHTQLRPYEFYWLIQLLIFMTFDNQFQNWGSRFVERKANIYNRSMIGFSIYTIHSHLHTLCILSANPYSNIESKSFFGLFIFVRSRYMWIF